MEWECSFCWLRRRRGSSRGICSRASLLVALNLQGRPSQGGALDDAVLTHLPSDCHRPRAIAGEGAQACAREPSRCRQRQPCARQTVARASLEDAEEITLWYYNSHFWRSYETPICRPFWQLFADGRWSGSANEAYGLDGAFCGASQRSLF